MRFALTFLGLLLTTSSVLAADFSKPDFPPAEEIWTDELDRTIPEVQVKSESLFVRLLPGTASPATCTVPTRLTSADQSTLMTKRFCFSAGSPREIQLQTSVRSRNVWLIPVDPAQHGRNCVTLPFEYDEDTALVHTDRNLRDGCYIVVYQSALLKHSPVAPKNMTTQQIQVEQR